MQTSAIIPPTVTRNERDCRTPTGVIRSLAHWPAIKENTFCGKRSAPKTAVGEFMRSTLRLLVVLGLVITSLPVVAQVTTATLPVGSFPDVVAVNTITNQIYTVNAQCLFFPCSSPGTVTVTDGNTHNVIGTVNVGYSPADTVVNPTTNKIYVANVCGNDATCQSPGTVTVIDGATLQTKSVTVGYAPGFSLNGVAINQTTNTIYVANQCPGAGWPNSCPAGSGTVTVIDGSTLATQSVTAGRRPINLAVDSQTTDREVMAKLIREKANKYIVRQLCWVLSVHGAETYILVPRDGDYQPLVDAYRAEPSPADLELVIGVRGPVAPPTMCNGLQVPIVIFDQIYAFDRESLLKSITAPKGDTGKFRTAAAEMAETMT